MAAFASVQSAFTQTGNSKKSSPCRRRGGMWVERMVGDDFRLNSPPKFGISDTKTILNFEQSIECYDQYLSGLITKSNLKKSGDLARKQHRITGSKMNTITKIPRKTLTFFDSLFLHFSLKNKYFPS
jgi:hypothetical protein